MTAKIGNKTFHQCLPTTQVEILEAREAFEDIEGEFRFTKTLVVYRDGKDTYHATSKARLSELSLDQLNSTISIPVTAYSPLFSPAFTQAPNPLPPDTYVKKPSLLSYDRVCQGPQPNSIADDVLSEVEIWEVLKQTPHPNIARYLGCQVLDGRIVGICLERYGQTLMEAINPQGFMKRKLSTTRQGLNDHVQLDGIEAGLRHLHSLGLVHNDLTPSNIVRGGKDGNAWVIIDFGSCRYKGKSLDNVGRTYEWHDEGVQTSLPQNDLDALNEIRLWLCGAPSNAFQFKE
ncbi:Serine/threonine-protein kinase/endoribonuclease IRE2 [Colletotrichum shisoi]|uniref:Serine/threonine-protein kinase/endoribonuclease IRE2 n=1 Tax=Colletotrichum shisoi TaxID=2078593 RepID=A0A5Q4BAZ2_9PEZI|nr:Serine/threonine-protein kinase/endoribonuclease IRE2 [Colletotrichum shisoi]